MAPSHYKKSGVSFDDVAKYLARGCLVHPPLYDHFLDQLEDLHRRGQVSLTPSVIFKLYHRKLARKYQKVRKAA